ncbi:menaquinone-dependent protoporphyrinogen IX dehydrogenase [Wielerella bovis]|uniref:menaquinone-dependent protoporphyrinogen IX dehydrogenase n=1 Tax=Wielerella bovis TaxID=2917790 RepID=UPI002018CC8B|nr:menaquinone-dependent protoporphyrinogen IX dehydrogenase [Wielerella bovis]ULJ70032.1 menaquinone-dependent protoporphyrinogen IX dehydrogenase [Wielerella bovis]
MSKILILYSTTDGHTITICRYIANALPKHHAISIIPLREANAEQLHQADKILIGASIRYGKHQPEVKQFVEQHSALLQAKPAAFFSVNVVARKPHRNTVQTNPYARKFLNSITWQPNLAGVFAGRLDYARYSFWDRRIIRFIMWLGKGLTPIDTPVEFTDWQVVAQFAEQFEQL